MIWSLQEKKIKLITLVLGTPIKSDPDPRKREWKVRKIERNIWWSWIWTDKAEYCCLHNSTTFKWIKCCVLMKTYLCKSIVLKAVVTFKTISLWIKDFAVLITEPTVYTQMKPIPKIQCNVYRMGRSIKELHLPGYKVEI